jgi:dihydropteroate synthase
MSVPSLTWQLRDRTLDLHPGAQGVSPLVMGIVNITPDSFSDGGRYLDPARAVHHALTLVDQGAGLLDLGAESSRPGAEPVCAAEELRRLLPVIRELAGRLAVPLSVDTTKAEVAQQALEAGAHLINDISALREPEMVDVVRTFRAGVVLMHMQGTPSTMQQAPTYPQGVVPTVVSFLQERLQSLVARGVPPECIALDPGIGFGKTLEHNLALIVHLGALQSLGRPVCLGVSRKRFLDAILGRPVHERLAGSLAVAAHVVQHQSAHILRVHDVAETVDVVRVLRALSGVQRPETRDQSQKEPRAKRRG